MPYRACSVKGCFNKNTDNNSDISFFSTSNDALKQKWLSASPFGWKTHKNLIICSEHFVDEDFVRKRSFEKLQLQMTMYFFSEKKTFFSDMECGHKYNIVGCIVKCFLNLRYHYFSKLANKKTHSLRKKFTKLLHNKGQ